MREDIRAYAQNPKYSCLLMGRKGLELDEDALELACAILKTTEKRLLLHPDFMLVDSGKEKTIGIEKASEVISKASYVPALADKIVVLIKEFDKLTEQAQNVLLKLIEESENVLIIGTCYQDNVLSTIKSRCTIFNYIPYTREQFERYCLENGLPESELLFYLTDGCPGLVKDEPEILKVFEEVKGSLDAAQYFNLLTNLHLLEEKDKDNFYQKYPGHVKNLFRLLGNHFQKKWTSEPDNCNLKQICGILNENISLCNTVQYSKDNFFMAFAQIISIMED